MTEQDKRNIETAHRIYSSDEAERANIAADIVWHVPGHNPVSGDYHGFEEYIDHGVDGFVVPDNPLSYAQVCAEIINNHYQEAIKMGQLGKAKARKLFHIDRYHKDLHELLVKVASGQRPQWNGSRIWD